MKSEKVVGIIPKLLFKLFLTLKDKFDPKPVTSDEEITATAICEKLISNTGSELSFSPISRKRIIKNEEKNMYVVMENFTIHVINHVYSYSVYLQDTSEFERLAQLFDQILENRRQELELEIKKNIQHSLKIILGRID